MFALGPYVRARYDKLFDERMQQLRSVAWTRLRRSLRASVAGSLLTALTYGGLVALLLDDQLSAATAVPAAVGLQQLGGRPSGIATSAGLIYENSLSWRTSTRSCRRRPIIPRMAAVPLNPSRRG